MAFGGAGTSDALNGGTEQTANVTGRLKTAYVEFLFGARLSEPISVKLAGALLWYIYIFVSMGSPFGLVGGRKRATRKCKAG